MAKKYNDCMTIRINKQLKENFSEFCEKCGINTSTAVNLFIRKTIEKQKIPFQISPANKLKSAYEGGEPQVVRAAIRIDPELREEFKKISSQIGIPMGRLIKMFMLHCLNKGKIPF